MIRVVREMPRALRRRREPGRAMPLALGLGLDLARFERPASAAAFTPASLAALAFWFDFGDASTLFTDTAGTTPALDLDPVARVNDKSGNGRFLQQATGTQRPTRDASFAPPVVFFDGGDRLISAATFGPIAQPYSILLVSDNSADNGMFWDSGTAGTRQTAARGVSATEVGFFAGAVVTRSGVPTLATRRAWLFVYNGASSQVWVYDAGTAAFVQQGANGNAGANTLAEMRLGGNSVNFLQSTATSEVFAWAAAASAGDRTNIAGYVGPKWSLT